MCEVFQPANEEGSFRMLRGSWWNNPGNCRSSNRNNNDPSNRNSILGFRVARSSANAMDFATD